MNVRPRGPQSRRGRARWGRSLVAHRRGGRGCGYGSSGVMSLLDRRRSRRRRLCSRYGASRSERQRVRLNGFELSCEVPERRRLERHSVPAELRGPPHRAHLDHVVDTVSVRAAAAGSPGGRVSIAAGDSAPPGARPNMTVPISTVRIPRPRAARPRPPGRGTRAAGRAVAGPSRRCRPRSPNGCITGIPTRCSPFRYVVARTR